MLRIAAFLLLAGIAIGAWSNPPTPSRADWSYCEQDGKYTADCDSEGENPNSNASPSTVEIGRPDNAATSGSAQPGNVKQEPTHDWWAIVPDIVIASATVILTIATVFLMSYTRKLWGTTHDTLKLAREEFNATHRPRLRIRAISVEGGHKTVRVYISNVGDSGATITNIYGGVFFDWDNKIPPMQSDKHIRVPDNSTVPPGGFCNFPIAHMPEAVPRATVINGRRTIVTMDGATFAMATIIYSDNIGIQRRTRCGWKYDVGIEEFTKPERDDQYNYED